MIVLDASVLIGHFNMNDAHHARATEILRRNIDQSFGCSAVTLAEVFVGPMRQGTFPRMRNELRAFDVEELPLPSRASELLARCRVETALKLPDCCVLVTAEVYNAELATLDKKLAGVAQDRGVVVHCSP